MDEFKCSVKECICYIDEDDWHKYYGICAQCYGKFAPVKIRELEKNLEELELDLKVKQNYIDNAGDLEKKIRELEATICDLEILLRKKTERIVELETKIEDDILQSYANSDYSSYCEDE